MTLAWNPDELGYSHLLYECHEQLLCLLHRTTVGPLAVEIDRVTVWAPPGGPGAPRQLGKSPCLASIVVSLWLPRQVTGLKEKLSVYRRGLIAGQRPGSET